jgi:hypothetical protein
MEPDYGSLWAMSVMMLTDLSCQRHSGQISDAYPVLKDGALTLRGLWPLMHWRAGPRSKNVSDANYRSLASLGMTNLSALRCGRGFLLGVGRRQLRFTRHVPRQNFA